MRASRKPGVVGAPAVAWVVTAALPGSDRRVLGTVVESSGDSVALKLDLPEGGRQRCVYSASQWQAAAPVAESQPVPQVYVAGDASGCSGLYDLVEGEQEAGLPVWMRAAPPTLWLRSAQPGAWIISSARAGSSGVVRSEPHSGAHPHRVAWTGVSVAVPAEHILRLPAGLHQASGAQRPSVPPGTGHDEMLQLEGRVVPLRLRMQCEDFGRQVAAGKARDWHSYTLRRSAGLPSIATARLSDREVEAAACAVLAVLSHDGVLGRSAPADALRMWQEEALRVWPQEDEAERERVRRETRVGAGMPLMMCDMRALFRSPRGHSAGMAPDGPSTATSLTATSSPSPRTSPVGAVPPPDADALTETASAPRAPTESVEMTDIVASVARDITLPPDPVPEPPASERAEERQEYKSVLWYVTRYILVVFLFTPVGIGLCCTLLAALLVACDGGRYEDAWFTAVQGAGSPLGGANPMQSSAARTDAERVVQSLAAAWSFSVVAALSASVLHAERR